MIETDIYDLFRKYDLKFDADHKKESMLILLHTIILKIKKYMTDYPITTHYHDGLFQLEIDQLFELYRRLIRFEVSITNDCDFDESFSKFIDSIQLLYHT